MKIHKLYIFSLLTSVFSLSIVTGLFVNQNKVDASNFPGVNGKLTYSKSGGDITNYTVFTKLGSNDPVAITDGNQADMQATWSADGTKLTFMRNETGGGGAQDIWYMNADGSNQVAILQDNGVDEEAPRWTPDGKSIVYQSPADGDWDIYIHNTVTDTTTKLTDNSDGDTAPSVSPDGTKIVYRNDSDGDVEIYTMDIDGSNPTQITTNSLHDYYPTWTPDGERLVHTRRDGSNHAIFIIDSDGNNETNLTNDSSNSYLHPSVSPDGETILFSSNRDGVGFDIYEMDVDGSNVTRIIDDDDTVDYWPAYQPLTINPISSNSNPNVSAGSDGIALIDVPALYTDAYEGIDKNSVIITDEPSNGTTSIDNNGIVTYRQSAVADAGIFSKLVALAFPVAYAQSSTDSFSYKICSLSSSNLCSEGNITINLTNLDSAELSNTGLNYNQIKHITGVILIVSIFVLIYLRLKSILWA